MARCGCAGTTCSCVIRGSGSISVDGAGSVANPYVISGGAAMQVVDTGTVDLTLTGSGSPTEPFVLKADALISLNELLDVDTTGGTTGQVLTRQSDGTYKLAPPVTASAGTIAVNANSITGDGSSGSPLAVKLVSGGGLVSGASGLSVQGFGAWAAFTPVLGAATTNPNIGNGSRTGFFVQLGKTVHFRARITWGTTTTRGVGSYTISLPVAPRPGQESGLPLILNAVGSGLYLGVARTYDDGSAKATLTVNTASRAENIAHASPGTMSAGSTIDINGSYEAA